MAREISYNNFEISLVVFMPNITINHAITYTNSEINDREEKEKEHGSSKLTSLTILCSPVSACNKTKKER